MAAGIPVTTPGVPNAKVVAENVAPTGDPEHVQYVKSMPSGLLPVGVIQALTVAASSVALPSIPSDATYAMISLENGQIRWNDDGSTAPSTTVGHLLTPPAGDSLYFMLEGRQRILNWRGIRTGGTSGALQVTYYKAVTP